MLIFREIINCCRAFEKCEIILDNRHYFFRSGSLYHLQADPAENRPCHLPKLRQTQKAGHGPVPSLQKQMACPGTDSAGLASCRLTEKVIDIFGRPCPLRYFAFCFNQISPPLLRFCEAKRGSRNDTKNHRKAVDFCRTVV